MTTALSIRHRLSWRVLALLALVASLLVAPQILSGNRAAAAPVPVGHPGSAFLSNFDVINNTGVTCQGFDVQIEGITPADAPYQYYGTYGQPTITAATVNGVAGIDVRWAAINAGPGVWSASSAPGAMEHFGVYVTTPPGNQHLSWLCEDPANPSQLIPTGGTAVGNGYTANTLTPPVPQVQSTVVPTATGEQVQQNIQNGQPGNGAQDAVWYYRYAQSNPTDPQIGALTPDNGLAVSAMSQSQINDALNLVNGGSAETATEPVSPGDASSVWVVQEYAYTGPYDDAHTPLCNETVGDPNNCANFVGPMLSTTVLDTQLANAGNRTPINVSENVGGTSNPNAGTVVSSDLSAVNANPGNIQCPGTCTSVVDTNSTETLTAAANPGYTFAGWSGSCAGTTLTCTLSPSSLPAGSAATVKANFTQSLQVTQPLKPALVWAGKTATVTVKGLGFAKTATPSFSGSGVSASAISVTNGLAGSTMKFTATAAPGAAAGLQDIIIHNPTGPTAICTACLKVGRLPQISSISPTIFKHGTSFAVTITGSDFQAGAKVAFSGGYIAIKTTPAKVVTPSSISFSVSVNALATLGTRVVTVTNPDSGKATTTITVS